jgi:hypothetical protein
MKTNWAGNNGENESATDFLARHTVATLPDSLEGRRRVLCALLAACPRSRYAERIAIMLEHLEQHQACALKVQNSTTQKKESHE